MKNYLISIYLLSPLVPIGLLWAASPGRYQSPTALIAMVFGTAAFTWINWQFLLAARPKWVDRVIGLDKMYRFHGMAALGTLVLMYVHYLIRSAIYAENLMTQLGTAAMLLFMAISLLSVLMLRNSVLLQWKPFQWIKQRLQERKILKFHKVMLVHQATVIGLVLVQIHVLLASTVRSNPLVYVVMMGYFLIGLLSYLYQKLFKPWMLLEKSYQVQQVIQETQNIRTLLLSPKNGHAIRYRAGQFGFFRIFGDGVTSEEHPFSISSTPTNRTQLSITVKALGDYTGEIFHVKVGDEVLLDGPYGRFSYELYPDEDAIAFIAGGVGITPVLSMLRHMEATGSRKRTMLIWGLQKENEMVAASDIQKMVETMPHLTVVPIVSADPTYPGEKGYIDSPKLLRLLGSQGLLQRKTGFYLCGPGPMMQNSLQWLRDFGIENKQIHAEVFSM